MEILNRPEIRSFLNIVPDNNVGLGSLVCIRDANQLMNYFITQKAGGLEVFSRSETICTLNSHLPLGALLISKSAPCKLRLLPQSREIVLLNAF